MKKLTFLFYVLAVILISGCNDSDTATRFTHVQLKVVLPELYTGLTPDNLNVKVVNKSTNQESKGMTDATGVFALTLEEGVYNIEVSGEKERENTQQEEQTLLFQGTLLNKSIVGTDQVVTIELELAPVGKEWVIKEVYFTGSKTLAGKPYWQDQYIEVYNNSDKVLYADGLTVSEVANLTTGDVNDWGAFLPGRVVVQTIYSIPGDGTSYPVEPGKSVVLANNASNHKSENPNSPVDMSEADFEWYDDHALDVDVPEVPNLIKHYSYSVSVWMLHNRGYRSYIIFKPDTDMTAFMEKNEVEGVSASGKTLYRYAIPSELILDGVELSASGGLKSKALPASVDAGYSYCTAAGNGLVVKRKVLRVENGVAILQDTNNSSEDFQPNQQPSPFVVK